MTSVIERAPSHKPLGNAQNIYYQTLTMVRCSSSPYLYWAACSPPLLDHCLYLHVTTICAHYEVQGRLDFIYRINLARWTPMIVVVGDVFGVRLQTS